MVKVGLELLPVGKTAQLAMWRLLRPWKVRLGSTTLDVGSVPMRRPPMAWFVSSMAGISPSSRVWSHSRGSRPRFCRWGADDVSEAAGTLLLGPPDTPFDHRGGKAERVGLRRGQVDAVVWVGGLLSVDVESEDSAFADGAAAFEAGV